MDPVAPTVGGTYELLTWGSLFSMEVLAVLFLALAIVVAVALRPRIFWPVLLASVILGNLPKVKGYVFADEILLGAVILGSFAVLMVRKMPSHGKVRIRPHTVVFLFWMLYLIAQSFRGMQVTGDTRVVRWIYLYGLLAIGVFIMSKRDFQPRSIRTVLITVTLSNLTMFVAYLAQGVFFQSVFGPLGRFLSQWQFVAGPAYAVFPIVIALPSSILLLQDPSRRVRILSWLNLLVTMAVAYYFDTRIAWLVMAMFFVVMARHIRFTRLVSLSLVFMGLGFLWLPNPREVFTELLPNLVATANVVSEVGEADRGRVLDLQAGLITANNNPLGFFFGYGVNTHKTVVKPAMVELRNNYHKTDPAAPGTPDYNSQTSFHTVGFTALLLDTGWIGILLWLLSVALLARKVLLSGTNYSLMLLAILLVVMLWPLSNNIWDIVLLYLLIMPYGLVELMSRYTGRPSRVQERELIHGLVPDTIG